MSRGYKPKVLHANDGGRLPLCGWDSEGRNWAEQYLTDEFAQSLPPCQGCLAVLMERGWELPKIWRESKRFGEKPNLLEMTTTYEPEPLVVAQSGGILQSSDEQMSLREWCE